MRKLRNIPITIGGCITKEKIAVILMLRIKGSWKAMLMVGMKPKNTIRRFSQETLEKLSSYGRKKVRMSIPKI